MSSTLSSYSNITGLHCKMQNYCFENVADWQFVYKVAPKIYRRNRMFHQGAVGWQFFHLKMYFLSSLF